MELAEFAKEVYLFFTSKVYSKPATGSVTWTKSIKAFEHFGTEFSKTYASAGPEWTWFFVAFQFSRFEIVNFKPNGFYNFVAPVNVFEKKAVKAFVKRETIDALTVRSPWMQRLGVTKEAFVSETGYTFTGDKLDVAKAERNYLQQRSPVKAIVVDTLVGPDACYELTDLYNPLDPACLKCPYSKQCKLRLSKVNPIIYKLRNL